ncbi:hypothetical protein PVK06_024854 [Gossypium arboreum]|uniref:Uncharacterized protein n=1 Tax=Gossypium arboreum TaxID=29729 RepID=A0ABR0PEY2_GOSAR|nr:hypothetical protein PVK06_024854 [Gossypium arboreum]
MEFLDDNNIETMVALYCLPKRVNTEPIQLFAGESVNRRSPVRDFDIDLNVGRSYQYSGGLQIHLVFIETSELDEDESDNNDYSDHECEDFSDPDLDNVPDDMTR